MPFPDLVAALQAIVPTIAAEYPAKVQANRADVAASWAYQEKARQEEADRRAQAPASYPTK
ncbi:hypothetical protein SAMN02745121_05801 [Nannocystis exedens]|uniref:Uncharacterized protein n=1 Tax=Nannocystis exedens TaxID=54 RepID=A0A1I2DY81_9BACT|nr:hypothetical protein [Nannocystis exedens]PCC69154.1 hypothetical protein NAEX_02176 [Nannocystis exedens]SFE85604.1 hypothetical protein SAMN02745121_05801 [Nannocystis exedens]